MKYSCALAGSHGHFASSAESKAEHEPAGWAKQHPLPHVVVFGLLFRPSSGALLRTGLRASKHSTSELEKARNVKPNTLLPL